MEAIEWQSSACIPGPTASPTLRDLGLESHPKLTALTPTEGILFREWPKHGFMDWHPAPRRQYVINISGGLEIGLGDGSLHRFGPGDARLVEDTTGQGHTTRVIGEDPTITAIIPLDD